MKILEITRERFEVVRKEISEGSEPALRFYLLVAVSTLIASFGLIANSTAVVIGAMLVAPLMTPIFGISLALVRGDTVLLGRAVRAEVAGVVAAISMGFLLGSLLGDFEPTAEMLSRTRPNLFDLIVAVLAGFAGAYAMVDEKISPALPGVAIATAIVPPLANAGLCFSLDEVSGGIGSFLLFFANFLSILMVASATFVLSGMARRYGASATRTDFARRFGLPFVAFVLISAFLANSLIKIYHERWITKTIRATLTSDLSLLPASYLGDVHHYSEAGKVYVIANVHAPVMLRPTQVTGMQDRISEQIKMPAELILHCVLSNNVSALGSVKNVIKPGLDGTYVKTRTNNVLNDIATSEQIVREFLADDQSVDLIRIEPLKHGQREIMLAHVLGVRQLTAKEIGIMETRIRKATGKSNMDLAFSSIEKTLKNTDGVIQYGWILGDQATLQVRELIRQIRLELTAAFESNNRFALANINATRYEGTLYFLLEITGPELYPSQTLEALQARLSQKYSEPIVLYAWSRIEVVHGPEGALSMARLNQSFSDRQKENLPGEIPLLLEAVSR